MVQTAGVKRYQRWEIGCRGWVGLGWIGLDWTGLDWTGLDWAGLGWREIASTNTKNLR